jgi:hypothetical protein
LPSPSAAPAPVASEPVQAAPSALPAAVPDDPTLN